MLERARGDPMIGHTVDRYRVLEELGTGAMGTSWLADDPYLSRRVVLQFLPDAGGRSEAACEHFVRDARAACFVSHPGLARIYAAGEHEGHVFVASEYVEGEAVSDAVKRDALSTDMAIRIAREVA